MEQRLINKIQKELKNKSWGKVVNELQDVAEKVLTPGEWRIYLFTADKDFRAGENTDGVVIGGQYFDWKEFESKAYQIVEAYLSYFNTGTQLARITAQYIS